MWKSHAAKLAFLLLATVAVSGVAIWWWLTRRPLPPEFAGRLASPADRLTLLVLSPEGRYLAAGAADGSVIAWDLVTDESRVLESASGTAVVCMAISPDGLVLASSLNGQLRGWQLPQFERAKIESPEMPLTVLAFRRAPAEPEVLFGLPDGRVGTLGAPGLTLRSTKHRGVKAMLLIPEQDVLVTGGTEGDVVWFDLKQRAQLGISKRHDTEVSSLVLSPDGKRLASGDWNGRVCVWNISSRQFLNEARQSDAVSALAWNADQLITGSWDGRIRVWHVDQSQPTIAMTIDTGRPIHGLVLLPDGQRVATVSATSNVELWRLNSGLE